MSETDITPELLREWLSVCERYEMEDVEGSAYNNDDMMAVCDRMRWILTREVIEE